MLADKERVAGDAFEDSKGRPSWPKDNESEVEIDVGVGVGVSVSVHEDDGLDASIPFHDVPALDGSTCDIGMDVCRHCEGARCWVMSCGD